MACGLRGVGLLVGAGRLGGGACGAMLGARVGGGEAVGSGAGGVSWGGDGGAVGGCGRAWIGGGAGGAGWTAAGGGCTVRVMMAGWPVGVGATVRVTAVLSGSGVSSFRTKFSPPAVSWVSPAASWAVTLASMLWPMRRTSASRVARTSLMAASAGSAAGSGRVVSWARRAATSGMPPACRESG
ncbi:MAG: hypothetical protein JWQ89_1482 [Devosia sp.]|nr:hypothetical protein [Devosia sp.]